MCVSLQASVEFYYSQRGRVLSGRGSCRLSGWASFAHLFAQRWRANSSSERKYLEGELMLVFCVCLCVQEPRLRLRPGALGCFTQVTESISPSPPSVSGFKVQTRLNTSTKHTQSWLIFRVGLVYAGGSAKLIGIFQSIFFLIYSLWWCISFFCGAQHEKFGRIGAVNFQSRQKPAFICEQYFYKVRMH